MPERSPDRFRIPGISSRAVEMAGGPVEGAEPGPCVAVPVDRLQLHWSLRERTSEDHVKLLVEAGPIWPPILVDGTGTNVIDGVHRVVAARRMGIPMIAAVVFEGTRSDALVEALKANTRHGLPLTLTERKHAAGLLVGARPEMSDRLLASISGLSPKTVGALRVRNGIGVAVVDSEGREIRLGKDGSWRPARSRRRAMPDRGPSSWPAPSTRPGIGAGTATTTDSRNGPQTPSSFDWEMDTACRSTEKGLAFAKWMQGFSELVGHSAAFVDVVPLSRVHLVIDEVHAAIETMSGFAEDLRARTSGGRR